MPGLRRIGGKAGLHDFKFFKMKSIEQIELEFTPAFDARIREVIESQKPIYAKKYPFVGKIITGMGGVAVYDKDGVILFETNWPRLDAEIAERSSEDEDDIFNENQKLREEAEEDDFIDFLREAHCHKLCSFCPEDIIFT